MVISPYYQSHAKGEDVLFKHNNLQVALELVLCWIGLCGAGPLLPLQRQHLLFFIVFMTAVC